jgi:hypothetical protein
VIAWGGSWQIGVSSIEKWVSRWSIGQHGCLEKATLGVTIFRCSYCIRGERVEKGGDVDFWQHRGPSRIRGVFRYIGRMHKAITANGLEGV